MKCFVLLAVLVFASKNENDAKIAETNLGEKIMENAENPIVVKIEEDECDKRTNTSKYLGVSFTKKSNRWTAQRWSKNEKKILTNGYYKDEETAAHASDTLARELMENGEQNHKLNFPDDNTEVRPEERTTSFKSFGVCYNEKHKKWAARRWSKTEQKIIFNGANYKDKETAAHASDTLARKLMADGEENHKLNFPDDSTEVYAEEKEKTFEYIGVYYHEKSKLWVAQRWDKSQKKLFKNGYYKNKETAARASDTLARELMAKGEQDHNLNFPDDNTEVYARERKPLSKYFGIYYNKQCKQWIVQRWSKRERKVFSNGNYRDEETAAHASDTLARELMANGEQIHKLNFPDNNTEVHPKEQQNKRKRSFDFGYSQANENIFEK